MSEQFIDQIRNQTGCVVFRGATDDEISETNKTLSKHNFCAIPKEYALFLHIYDGMIYDGLEFLGTKPHRRQQKNYTLSSITDINKRYSRFDFFNDKVILGEMPESFIIYDSKTNSYEITDRLNLDSKRTFNSFKDFLKTITQFLVIKQ